MNILQATELPGEGAEDADSGNESRSGGEDTHVCEKCCAEFFKWADLLAHKEACTKNPLVLIVGEDEPAPPSEDFPEASPASAESPPSLCFTQAAAVKSLQSWPTLCDPTDSSPPGSPVPGILQARTLEWVAISFSMDSSKKLIRCLRQAGPWVGAGSLARSKVYVCPQGPRG